MSEDIWQTCIKCNSLKQVEHFAKDSRQLLGVQRVCKACKSLKNKDWRKSNENHIAFKNVERRANKLNCNVTWANKDKIKDVYILAKAMSSQGIKYHVDHIVPLNSQIVCGLHCEYNLQIITAAENLSKRNLHWPHKP